MVEQDAEKEALAPSAPHQLKLSSLAQWKEGPCGFSPLSPPASLVGRSELSPPAPYQSL